MAIPADEQYQRTIDILCQECLTPEDELTNDTAMADLLSDPLLSVAISTRLKKELQLDVSADDLINLRAISDLKTTLLGSRTDSPILSVDPSPQKWPAMPEISTPVDNLIAPLGRISPITPTRRPSHALSATSVATSIDKIAPWKTPAATPIEEVNSWQSCEETSKAMPSATSAVLQGRPESASRAVFLFPDGSGSERSYVNLPRIALDLVVYGLQCPYLKNPKDMQCTWDELVETYITAIRSRQSNGPYDFVGYAAGGALAFRAAQLLTAQNEQINSLTLLNSPIPEVLGQLSDELYEYIRSIRAWSKHGFTPEWVLPHLKAFTKILNTCRQRRCGIGAVRNVRILWAGLGVPDGAPAPPPALSDGEQTVVKFLTEARTDFGPCGWELLLPGSKIWCGKIDAGHFEMMVSRAVTFLNADLTGTLGT